jgi:uncharacterized protein with LGFP repeats
VKFTDAKGCLQTGCWKAVFDGGRIYDHAKVTHEIHGAVLTYYLHSGGAPGPLGFPITDVQKLSSPAGSVRSTFEHGTVTCSASGHCTGATS